MTCCASSTLGEVDGNNTTRASRALQAPHYVSAAGVEGWRAIRHAGPGGGLVEYMCHDGRALCTGPPTSLTTSHHATASRAKTATGASTGRARVPLLCLCHFV